MDRVNETFRRLLIVAVLAGPAGAAEALSPGLLPRLVGVTEEQGDLRSGFGLSGYDPVSYLLEGRPRAGLAEHELVRGGVAWRFASRANRAAFERDPESFLPRIGGYDAAAAAVGRLAGADPTVFAIRDARLYLFRNVPERDRFLLDETAPEAAEESWERLRARLVRG